MEKLEIFIRVSCQFFVVNGPLFEEIFGGEIGERRRGGGGRGCGGVGKSCDNRPYVGALMV